MPEGSPEVYSQIDSPEAAAQMIVDHPPESAEELLSMLDKSGFSLAPAAPMEEPMMEEPMMEEMGPPMLEMEEEEGEMEESEEEHGGFKSKKDQLRNEPIGITILSVAGKAMKKGKKKKGKDHPKEDESGY